MNIKTIVKNNRVRFVRYRQGFVYYAVEVKQEPRSAEFTFPVPLNDVGEATLLAEDKAIVYMRYIRKALEQGTFLPVLAANGSMRTDLDSS